MIFFDIEADSLRPSKIWCVCYYDDKTDTTGVFHEDTKEACKELFESGEILVGHNILSYDLPVLEQLWGIHVPVKFVYDTVVAARLADPKREEGHSLRAYGDMLGFPKGDCDDFSHWSESMESYCHRDVAVTRKVYDYLQKELQGFSKISVQIEMRCQYILSLMHWGGFSLDIKAAVELKNKCDQEYMQLIQKIQKAFPPRKVLVGQYKARRRLDGTLTAKSAEIIMRDCVEPTKEPDMYNVYDWKEFLIDSPSEIRERMAPYWHPVIWNKPTKDGTVTAKVCDANLETVGPDAPEEIKDIVRCKILKSRATLIQSFLDACWEDDRVHGDIFSVGAASNRMAHRSPNLGNVASPKSLYGAECRALYVAPEGKVMVGCDLAGIQLRAMAHYCNDPELIKQILEGDIHVHMARIYGLLPADVEYDETIKEHKLARSRGKTITYCILMGGGSAKVGQLAGGDAKLGKKIIDRISKGIKGWSRFKREIEMRAMKGYFIALDGRRVKLSNAHLGTSYYLQSFEQAIIKWAMWEAYKNFKREGIDVDWNVVVHDEIDIAVPPEQAERAGQIIQKAYQDAGKFYHVRIPLDGEYKIGKNWLEVH